MNVSEYARAARAAKRDHASSLGINDAYVERMVDLFYGRIRADAMLGPIFAEHVVEWKLHLERMNRFWRSVLFSSGEFDGNPMPKHVAIPNLERAHFARWLELFDETLGEIGSPAARALVVERARNIANSLLNAVVVHRDGGLGLAKARQL